MKIEKIVSVSITDTGYDVVMTTETVNTAIAHLDENWVVQAVSRIENNNGTQEISGYSVIPQPVREAVAKIKNDSIICESLLMNGVWLAA